MRAQPSDPRKCREITKRGTLDNQSKNLYNPSFAQTENRGAGNFVTPLKPTLPAPFGSDLQWSFGHLANRGLFVFAKRLKPFHSTTPPMFQESMMLNDDLIIERR